MEKRLSKIVLGVSLLSLSLLSACGSGERTYSAASGSSSERRAAREAAAREHPAPHHPTEIGEAVAEPPVEGQSPAEYDVVLDTTKGPIRIHVTRAWAPHAADRFYELVEAGYYTDVAFFRVIEGFMAQAGMHGDPATNRRWQENSIPDDPVTQSNTPGMVTFAARSMPNSRTVQFFINMGSNTDLDGMGFAPFGRTQDMEVVSSLYDGYGEGAPRGRGPSQALIAEQGNEYLRRDFPELDYIRTARIAR
jgi:peptidyl-prolyl cis-trans isomerase A (cyclophilin A)